eukprot:208857-Amphidinium_carterae.1
MDGRACTEAVAERLVWLLYPKFVHYSFTVTAVRMLRVKMLAAKGASLKDAKVVLSYTWLTVALFGPCLPILNALLAFLPKLFSVIHFDCDLQLLDTSIGQKRDACLESIGFRSVTLLALVLQFSNLPWHLSRSP